MLVDEDVLYLLYVWKEAYSLLHYVNQTIISHVYANL